ncbi:MAG: cytochrome b N-terminal domain-containing protein [Planctomycetota bacterium]
MVRDRLPNFGVLALIVAAGGLLTGPFLAINYAPTLDAARDSVAFVQEKISLGHFLRGLHHWVGTFALVLAAIHGWRLFWHGRYKPPRRLLWVLGCAIFLVLVGFAYTGYLLPGDERAYTGMGIMEQVAASTPLVGEEVSAVLKGGEVVSSATLARLYVIHTMVLPAALVGLVILFLVVWRGSVPNREPPGTLPPWPFAAGRDSAAAMVVLVALALAAWFLPPALGAKADPAGAGAADARPEWFFLWVNKLLELVPGATFLIAGLLPGLLVGLAVGLPWIARGTERDPKRRLPEIGLASAVIAALLVLTLLSVSEPAKAVEEEPAVAAQGNLEEQAFAVMSKFKCASCHIIDGKEGGDLGPPLERARFNELYKERFFRLKVSDPVAFWEFTAMIYKPKRLRPKPEEVEILVRYFFGKR